MMRTNEIPYWEKYILTLREAAEFFYICENIRNDWIYESRCDTTAVSCQGFSRRIAAMKKILFVCQGTT